MEAGFKQKIDPRAVAGWVCKVKGISVAGYESIQRSVPCTISNSQAPSFSLNHLR